jgi:predicted esterase
MPDVRIRPSWVLLFVFTLSTEAFGLQGYCFGPKNAERTVLYFHGILNPNSDESLKRIRSLLSRASRAAGVQIAAPISASPCANRPHRVCWPHEDPAARQSAWTQAIEFARSCSKRPVSDVMGFSNGGYLAGKMFFDCKATSELRFYIIGAAPGLDPDPYFDWSACGSAHLAAGRQDPIASDAARLYEQLKGLGARARFTLLLGGHAVDSGGIQSLLEGAPLKKNRYSK